MFISKAEKDHLIASVSMLQEQVRGLTAQVMLMMRHPEVRIDKVRKGREWTPEQRAIASERMKKWQAEAKAKKENK